MLASVVSTESSFSLVDCNVDSSRSMTLCFSSWSLRRVRISETRLACKVGVKRLGSRMLIFSSVARSLNIRSLLSVLSLPGIGGGEGEIFPGGVTERLERLEPREAVLELLGHRTSMEGVGTGMAGSSISSSVSQAAILKDELQVRPNSTID